MTNDNDTSVQNWLDKMKFPVEESTHSYIYCKPSISWFNADVLKKYKLNQNPFFTAAKKEEEKKKG